MVKGLPVRSTRSSRGRWQEAARVRAPRTELSGGVPRLAGPVEALSLPILGARWQSALDAAQVAVAAAALALPAEELRHRRARLDAERTAAARLLDRLARDHDCRPASPS
jgi:hypothetical protein